jgi:hypothetical protein
MVQEVLTEVLVAVGAAVVLGHPEVLGLLAKEMMEELQPLLITMALVAVVPVLLVEVLPDSSEVLVEMVLYQLLAGLAYIIMVVEAVAVHYKVSVDHQDQEVLAGLVV